MTTLPRRNTPIEMLFSAQVSGENGEEQLIQLTPEIQAQLFQVQEEEDAQVTMTYHLRKAEFT